MLELSSKTQKYGNKKSKFKVSDTRITTETDPYCYTETGKVMTVDEANKMQIVKNKPIQKQMHKTE